MVDVDPVLRRFGPHKRKAHERYAAFMAVATNELDDDVATLYAENDILGSDKFVDETIHRIGEVNKWASKHKPRIEFDAELLLSAIEDVFEIKRENLFGSAKNSRIIDAKEAFILIGKESEASITELSKFVGIDQSNASRKHDAARLKMSTNTDFASAKQKVEETYRVKIA